MYDGSGAIKNFSEGRAGADMDDKRAEDKHISETDQQPIPGPPHDDK